MTCIVTECNGDTYRRILPDFIVYEINGHERMHGMMEKLQATVQNTAARFAKWLAVTMINVC